MWESFRDKLGYTLDTYIIKSLVGPPNGAVWHKGQNMKVLGTETLEFIRAQAVVKTTGVDDIS